MNPSKKVVIGPANYDYDLVGACQLTFRKRILVLAIFHSCV